ncbi:hypothetical protein Tco_0430097, partial [Tanacetum coccineum]
YMDVAALLLRWAVAAKCHSGCSERSYSKETNCLDDAAFADSDTSSGTFTYIASQMLDATTKLTSHHHHRVSLPNLSPSVFVVISVYIHVLDVRSAYIIGLGI